MGPIATFAYAVTAEGAKKLIEAAAIPETKAYDVRLSVICRQKILDCMVVAPQLFEHYEPPEKEGFESSDVAIVNADHDHDHDRDHGDDGGTQGGVEPEMGHTGHIMNSARCRALFNATCRAVDS